MLLSLLNRLILGWVLTVIVSSCWPALNVADLSENSSSWTSSSGESSSSMCELFWLLLLMSLHAVREEGDGVLFGADGWGDWWALGLSGDLLARFRWLPPLLLLLLLLMARKCSSLRLGDLAVFLFVFFVVEKIQVTSNLGNLIG